MLGAMDPPKGLHAAKAALLRGDVHRGLRSPSILRQLVFLGLFPLYFDNHRARCHRSGILNLTIVLKRSDLALRDAACFEGHLLGAVLEVIVHLLRIRLSEAVLQRVLLTGW